MKNSLYDYIIVGGGIVGLSSAIEVLRRFPKAKLLLIEKEDTLAQHQTGHNSGVIHSGIYYKPGSFKAKFARQGSRSMLDFCQTHDIEHDICGKVIVATKPEQVPQLKDLYQRGLQNELNVSLISKQELMEIEPHVMGLEAISVPGAGIVNYKQVCQQFGKLVIAAGGEVRLGTKVTAVRNRHDRVEVETPGGAFSARFLINCAGLHSDRIAQQEGSNVGLKIVPFRGEYYEIVPEKRHLVKHLIYPVPNPSFPFLGVHYTRMIGGHVEAGPNAVLAFKREGYRKTDINLRDLAEVAMFPGFWKLAGKYWREGAQEMVRSVSKAAFVRSLQELIPEITAEDLVPAPAGVRAQALKSDGSLVDDFHVVPGTRCLHVCNAPSPAATASIEIGKYIASCVSTA
ncbi:L-2-hydroxyglutarate oxidase [Collimonas sp. OK607]|uniref:L-2-hydroxyglutarate oxidase n=1 Tax=Collimonas sp. OK607 TaxID=1798194 RepID=UPI0008E330C0|nr:L-2-hydroxyglutarate oxidase [Collimonas sp. OK607]SFA75651.1 L-2-hydroxyglutarate oxidase [Collimonas sp. OK607]